ncbi:MAG: DUF4011 domain-containing protein [Rhodothermales bacterium]
MNTVRAILEQKRLPLLDLSSRSALINYVLHQKRGIELIDIRAQEVFDRLIIEGQFYNFGTMSEPGTEAPKATRPASHENIQFQTPYSPSQLQARLSQTYFETHLSVDDHGQTVLFLTLGNLTWIDKASEGVSSVSPLILVPVRLQRDDVLSPFVLCHTGEDPIVNPAIRQILKRDFGLEMPAFDAFHPNGVKGFLDMLTAMLDSYKDWRVGRHRARVDLFNVADLAVFEDLDSESASWGDPEENALLKKVLLDGFEAAEIQSGETVSIDYLTSPGQINHVLDADNEQLLVLYDSLKGINQLIDGPPGTGKTQTITNLIGAAVAEEKKILFVSNKISSLSQVRDRLSTVGLRHFLLPLYGRHLSRRRFLRELQDAIMSRDQVQEDEQTLIESLVRTRDQLNVYVKSLHTSIRESGVTPYEAYNAMAELDQQLHGISLPEFDGSIFVNQTAATFDAVLERAKELETHLKRLGVVQRHPFWGSRKTLYKSTDKPEIRRNCRLAGMALNSLRMSATDLAHLMGTRAPNNSQDVIRLVRAASRVLDAPKLDGVHVHEEKWAASMEELVTLLETGAKLSKIRVEFDRALIPEAWDQDMLSVRQALVAHGTKKTRSLIGDYRKGRDKLAGLCRNGLPKTNEEQLEIVNALLESQRLMSKLEQHEALAKTLFGRQWLGIASDWEHLDKVSTWMFELHQDMMQDKISTEILRFLAEMPDLDGVHHQAEQVAQDFSVFLKSSRDAAQEVEMQESLGISNKSFSRIPFGTLLSLFAHWEKNVDSLQDIVALNHLAERLHDEGLGDIVKLAVTWSESSKYLSARIQQARYNALLADALNTRRTLAGFNSEVHANLITMYNELDLEYLAVMSKRILRRQTARFVRERIPSSDIHALLNELEERPKRLLSEMIGQTGEALLDVKPVIATTPSYLAGLLNSTTVQFDIVIFDDAERISSIDALGAIARSNQVIAFGDKQLGIPMPGQQVIDVSDFESDGESLYDMMKVKGAAFRSLRSYYRSGPISLISWLNKEIYNNSLSVFPYADLRKSAHEVRLHITSEAHQKSDGAPIRSLAGTVVDDVLAHAEAHPNHTIGIVVQVEDDKEPILRELDRRRRKNHQMEPFFRVYNKESFYVKTIEDAQGDIRDVLFLALPLRRRAKMERNTQQKSVRSAGVMRRRLAILGSLVRQQCHVYTDMTLEEINRWAEGRPDFEVLARFLNFMNSNHLNMLRPAIASKFEMAVGDALKANGYAVDYQVGYANSCIDMAVVDDKNPDAYLLGIQSDGYSYENARSARERERLQSAQLKNQGWQLHRIWSIEWFRNPQRELDRLIDRIENIREARSGMPSGDTVSVNGTLPEMKSNVEEKL